MHDEASSSEAQARESFPADEKPHQCSPVLSEPRFLHPQNTDHLHQLVKLPSLADRKEVKEI